MHFSSFPPNFVDDTMQILRNHIKPGKVYRRSDLEFYSRAIDRDLAKLTQEGVLVKLSQGLYHAPENSKFGSVPPPDHELVRAFLKSDDFLLFSPNAYNSLGLGFTQLYRDTWVYNHKRQGEFKLGGRTFQFRKKAAFPNRLTEEFLLVDALNNLHDLAEDAAAALKALNGKNRRINTLAVMEAAAKYGNAESRRILKAHLLTKNGERG